MKKTNNADINIYVGEEHLYYDFNNKNIVLNNSVKPKTIENLKTEISKNKKESQIVLGLNYEPYPSIEGELGLTRESLEFILKSKLGVSIITSSSLILRDIDILEEINKYSRVKIFIKLPCFNDYDLNRIINKTEEDMLYLIEKLYQKFELSLWVSPVLPFINDDINNLEIILNIMSKYNMKRIMYMGLSIILQDKYKDAFYKLLDESYKGLKSKYDSIRKSDYIIKSPKEEMVMKYISILCDEFNIKYDRLKNLDYIFSYSKRIIQLSLF